MRNAVLVALGICFLLTIGSQSFLMAKDEGDRKTQSLFEIVIVSGGVIGIIIILLSFLAGGLIVEHLVSLQRKKLIPPEMISEIESLLDGERYEELMEMCEGEPNVLTNILGAGIARIGQGYEIMRESMQSAGEEEALKLHQKISYLSLIGTIAPMLGLLGTVTGMIGAFRQIEATRGQADPAQLASGIYQALVTTCQGLIVAIPVLSAYFLFKNKVDKIMTEVGAIVDEVTERFRPVSQ